MAEPALSPPPEAPLVPDKEGLFRPQALAHLSAAQQPDFLLPLAPRRLVLPLVGMGIIAALLFVWSIVGSIPITVQGRGILIRPGTVVSIQSPVAGQLRQFYVREGDRVRKGTVLGVLDQASLRQQLELEKGKRAELTGQYKAVAAVQKQRTALERSILDLRRQDLSKRTKENQTLADQLRSTALNSIQQQRENLDKSLALCKEISTIQKTRLDQVKALRDRNATSREDVMQAEQQYLQARGREIELQGQLQLLEVRITEAEASYLERLDKIAQLNTQISESDIQKMRLDQQELELTTTQNLSLQEVDRRVAQLTLLVEKEGKIVSEHDGRILEATAAVGQVLAAGARICSLIEEDESSPLICLCYLKIKDGKLIQQGMAVQINPDPVSPQRYGSLCGQVRSITPFLVSPEAAINAIGNSEVARSLVAENRHMEVLTALEPNPATHSGYRWTSSAGPPMTMSAGTTVTVKVLVESRPPISFVLPFLRGWTTE